MVSAVAAVGFAAALAVIPAAPALSAASAAVFAPTVAAGRPAEDPGKGLAEMRRGIGLSRAGDVAGALEAFDHAASLAPALGDWSRALAAETAADAGDTATVRRLLAAMDPELVRERGWRALVKARRKAADPTGALDAALQYARELPSAAARAEAWVQVGELRLQLGDTADARAAFRTVLETAPQTRVAVDAARTLNGLPGIGPEDRLLIGRTYLRHGNVDRGVAGVDAYLNAGRGTPAERAELRLEVGRRLFQARRYEQAERRLSALANEEPTRRIAADALLLAGRSQFRQNKVTAARKTFERVAAEYPQEPAAAEALYILADLEHDAGNLDRAREYYRRAINDHPEIAEAGLAAMRLGGLAHIEGNFDEAVSIFERYRAHTDPGRAQQAAYWAALSYLRLGNQARAEDLLREVVQADPITYYGMRAADLLGESVWRTALAPEPPPAPASPELDDVIFRVTALRELGLDDAASFEIDRAREVYAENREALYNLAEAFHERGETFAAIRLGRQLHRAEGRWNARLLRIVYPFPYREIIIREARRRKIDPYLVAGLIRQESMFLPGAVSPTGAVGLMQLMPATARQLARQAGLGNITTARLKDPEINIKLGTMYLAAMLERYGGNVTEALVAYNAGPTRVVRWRGLPEYRDLEVFTERIPFAETRDYVKIVQQNARLYAALYGGLEKLGDEED